MKNKLNENDKNNNLNYLQSGHGVFNNENVDILRIENNRFNYF